MDFSLGHDANSDYVGDFESVEFFPDAKMPSWGNIWRQRYAHVDPWHYPPAEACLFQVLETPHGTRSLGLATHKALGQSKKSHLV